MNMAGVGGMFGAADRAPMPISDAAFNPTSQSLPKRCRVNISPDSTSSAKKRKIVEKPCTKEGNKPGKKQIRKKPKVPTKKKKATKKEKKLPKGPIDIFS